VREHGRRKERRTAVPSSVPSKRRSAGNAVHNLIVGCAQGEGVRSRRPLATYLAPVTIGVFVDPGVVTGADDPKNRNIEYDAFDDRYVTFLLTEIIPHVTRRYSITDDPARWGICGGK
jgi:hypothetical protein